MLRVNHLVVLFWLLSLAPVAVLAAEDGQEDEIKELRRMLQGMKIEYETRMRDLEERLAHAERRVSKAERNADEAVEIAEETAISAVTGSSSPNTFNPAIGAVLVARFADVGNNNGGDDIPGFLVDGEIGPGDSGFSLGESELNMNANIDPWFFGNLTLAMEDEDGETEIGVEEAWFQTTALPYGLTILAGRHFSGLGYLNKFHLHADDFTDRPLPYQAFLGGQYIEDGVQARWVAPTSLFLELGGALNWGSRFPASGNDGTEPGAWTLFAHLGDDVGTSHSWQAGLSYLSVDVKERGAGDEEADGNGVLFAEAFTGDSDLTVLDFVYKWAPEGNPTVRNVKLQAEYFWREEDGEFAALPYDGDQSGWYLQGVYQFAPRWRVGYRHDEVDTDNGQLFAGTVLEDPADSSQRDSVMIDWSVSEFSRLRFQYVYDQIRDKDSDNQFFLQYIMSIGAHGGHEF